jgi:FtsH-binding integral membrane protein
MSSHKDKYFTKLLIGFAAIILATLVTFYAIFEVANDSDWYFMAILSALLFCAGVFFCLSAFVHKVKADFSKRQKVREQQKASGVDF